MEVVWIRQFTPYIGNLVYAFAGILAVYLLATVMGSRDYRARAASSQPGDSASSWSLLALSALIPLIAVDPFLPLGDVFNGLRIGSIVFFCALAGFLTPLLVDSWSSGDPDRAGTAYAVNVAGSIVGPLIAGFWLLPNMGERWAIVVLSAPLFAIAGTIALRRSSTQGSQPGTGLKPKLQFALAIIAGVIILSVTHDFESRFAADKVRRDYAATVVAIGQGFEREILVNGINMTFLTPDTKYMVHMPLAFRSEPAKNGLVICFGMGTSFRSMLSWGIPTTAVDIIPSVPTLFGYFHADAQTVESSPLARIVIDDGRRFLDDSKQTYDVIVVDPPPPPQAAGSSLLYSRDFYEVVKKHLGRDGILQQWYPELAGDAATTASITKALMQSFPYVRAFRAYDGFGIHYLASMEPIPITSSSVLVSRMPSAAAADFVKWGPESNSQRQFDTVVSHELKLEDLVAEDPRVPAMRDDQPINEYFMLRRWFHYYK
jgi:spermidine synthase